MAVLRKFASQEKVKQVENNYDSSMGPFLFNKKTGFHIESAKDTLSIFNTLYSCLFAFPFFCIEHKLFAQGHELPLLIELIAVLPPIIAFDFFLKKYVFSNNKYLKYFRKFEKQDEQWLRKWKRITAAYCLGAVLTAGIGLLLVAAIIWYWR